MQSRIRCLCSLLRKLRERYPSNIPICTRSSSFQHFLRQKHLKPPSMVQKQLLLTNMWICKLEYIFLIWFYRKSSLAFGCPMHFHSILPKKVPQQKVYQQKACFWAELDGSCPGSDGEESRFLKQLVKAEGLQMQLIWNFLPFSASDIQSDRHCRQRMLLLTLQHILMISWPQMPHSLNLVGIVDFLSVSRYWQERHSFTKCFSYYATLSMMKTTRPFLIGPSKLQCQCARKLRSMLLCGICSSQLLPNCPPSFPLTNSMCLLSWLLDLRRMDHLTSTPIPQPFLTLQKCSWPCPTTTNSPFLCTPLLAWYLGEQILLISASLQNLILPLRLYSSLGRLIQSTKESLHRQQTSRNYDYGQRSQYSSVANLNKSMLDSSPLPNDSASYLLRGASQGGRHSKKCRILPITLLVVGTVRHSDLDDSSSPP